MMLPIRFVTLCLATLNLIHCKTYTGTYKTISPELQKLFQNNFKDRLSIWESSTCYKTFGLPHYEVGCHGTPNIAQNRTGSLTIPDEHYINSTSFCTSGGPIGYAVNGVALFNALDGRGRDAYYYEAETFDSCGAHTAPTEDYHYHIVPGSLCPSMLGSENCFPRIRVPATLQSSLGTTFLVGVANDGFPIFVTADANDRVREETELDNCGGKVIDNTYAYYVKPFFPYILGCYKGQIPRSSSCGDSDKKMCYCRGPTATTVNCLEELEGTLCPAEEPVPCGTMNGRCYNMIISDKGTFDNGLTNNPSDGSGCPNRTGGPDGMRPPPPGGMGRPRPNGVDGPPPNGMDGSLVNEMGGSPSTGMGQPPQNGMGGSLLNGIIGSPSNGMGQPPPDEMNGSPSNGMGGSLPNQIGGPLPNSMNGASLNGGMGIGQNDQNSEVGGMYPQWALNSLGRGNQQQYVPYYASRRGSQSIYPWSQQILRYLFNSAAVLGNGQGMQNSPPQQGNQPNMQYPPPQQPGNQYLPSQGNQQQGNQYLPPQGNQQQGNQYPPQGNQQQGNQYIPPQGNQQPANQYLSPQGNQQQGNQYIPPQGNQQQGNQYLPPQGNQQGNQFPPPQGNQQQGNQYLPPPPRDQQGNQYLPPQGNQQQGNQYLPPQGNQQQGNQYLPPQGNQYLPPQGNQQGNQYLPPPPRDQQGMQYLPPQY